MRADEPGPKQGRILLIDDDRVFGIWAAQVLCKRGGHELKHVLDPAAGLRCVESEPPLAEIAPEMLHPASGRTVMQLTQMLV